MNRRLKRRRSLNAPVRADAKVAASGRTGWSTTLPPDSACRIRRAVPAQGVSRQRTVDAQRSREAHLRGAAVDRRTGHFGGSVRRVRVSRERIRQIEVRASRRCSRLQRQAVRDRTAALCTDIGDGAAADVQGRNPAPFVARRRRRYWLPANLWMASTTALPPRQDAE
jgi:hypothetical protein